MTRASLAAVAVAVLVGGAAAQTPPAAPPTPQGEPNSASALGIPEELQVFGTPMPSVVKATALINSDVITQTDVDHRVALLVISQGGQIDPSELDRVREQVLRNLIDETLQIQAARAEEIEIKKSDVDKTIQRVAANLKQTPEQLAEYLKANGSSIRTMRSAVDVSSPGSDAARMAMPVAASADAGRHVGRPSTSVRSWFHHGFRVGPPVRDTGPLTSAPSAPSTSYASRSTKAMPWHRAANRATSSVACGERNPRASGATKGKRSPSPARG